MPSYTVPKIEEIKTIIPRNITDLGRLTESEFVHVQGYPLGVTLASDVVVSGERGGRSRHYLAAGFGMSVRGANSNRDVILATMDFRNYSDYAAMCAADLRMCEEGPFRVTMAGKFNPDHKLLNVEYVCIPCDSREEGRVREYFQGKFMP